VRTVGNSDGEVERKEKSGVEGSGGLGLFKVVGRLATGPPRRTTETTPDDHQVGEIAIGGEKNGTIGPKTVA